jgi:HD-GYP domain-containing protein (c-di-GMP phosphodiesterase class II)
LDEHRETPQATPAADAPRPRRSSLVLTVLAVLSFVGLVPLVLMGWQVASSLSTDLEANQKEIQLDKAKTIGGEVSRFIDGHFDRLESLAAAISHLAAPIARGEAPLDPSRFEQMLDDFVGTHGVLEIALVIPQQGSDRELAVHSPNIDPDALAKELGPRVAAAREKGTRGSRSLSNPFVPSERALQSLAVLGVPVRGAAADGSPRRAVLVAVVSMAPVQAMIESIGGMREGYTVYVLDDERRPFAHTDVSRVLQSEQVAPSELVAERLEPSSVSLTFDKQLADGGTRSVIGAYHPIEIDDHRWGVFVEVDHAAGLGQVEDMRRTTFRWGTAAFVLALVIGIVFSWRLTGPIHELIATTRRIAGGDFGRRAKVHGNNEISMLADHFNAMSEAIGRTVDDLKVQKELNDQLFLSSIRSLAAAIDARDPYTHGHSERVTRYARIIARAMKLSPEQMRNIEIGALLHDVGKIGIEDRILRKPAALTPEEFEIMKTHPEKGGQIMEPISFLREATEVIIHHHERWDGNGYPSGLKAEEIPLGARIVNVADTFDAMTTNRPYQRAMTFAVAAKKINDFSGKACDPRVVQAFLQAFEAGQFGRVAPEEEAAASATRAS